MSCLEESQSTGDWALRKKPEHLAALTKVYNQYRDMDAWIADPFFLIPDAGVNRQDRLMIRNLWEAVKAAVEGEHGTQT